MIIIRKIIVVFVVIVMVVLIGGIFKYFQPQKNYATSKPDYVLEVGELFAAFDNDETATTQKYVSSNCTLQVKGLLGKVVHESDSTVTVVIVDGKNSDASLNCNLAKGNESLLDKLKEGMPITVKGQCTGYQSLIDKSVFMIRGVVVE